MSDVGKDIGTIWSRLFDHKSFLSGEIQYTLQEFEQKRGDTEVDNLFKVIENITEIKETEIDRFKQTVKQILPETNKNLLEALDTTGRFADLENRYKEENLLEAGRQRRKADWDNFMGYITTTYSEINSAVETEEENLTKLYSSLEEKLTSPGKYP